MVLGILDSVLSGQNVCIMTAKLYFNIVHNNRLETTLNMGRHVNILAKYVS